MTLTASQFPAFYEALHGYGPFPWQARLVEEIAGQRDGCWPAVLDLPTASGKTSAIDAALFLLALEADKPLHERRAPLRIFFVVDRRIVVDQAADHAREIACLLNGTPADAAPVLRLVADRLRRYGGGKALHVGVLRGGMYRDETWARAPNQPTVCLSTVDQIGSRLLFRGYGVNEYQRAVHAGLVGNDALILLDEAHLSNPFLETLDAVKFYRGERWAERPVRTPFQVALLSATAAPRGGEPFGLAPEDREHPILKRRLEASKRARLVVEEAVKEDEGASRAKFAARLVAEAEKLATPPPPPELPKPTRAKGGSGRRGAGKEVLPAAPEAKVVGIVVNRVDTARRVYDLLRAASNKDAPAHDVILLTGRIRPYDRDELLFREQVGACEGWLEFMKAKENRPAPRYGKLFVVATQTVEVGADLSFDALVTEAAPLDALRQRFGRLDRLGDRKASDAVILARKDHLEKQYDDPVYGKAIRATWDWLLKRQSGTKKEPLFDFRISTFPAPEAAEVASLCSPRPCAPVMLPAHVDTWVQTTPTPVPDPDVGLFLHGPEAGPADVSVIWRADLAWEGVNLLERDGRAAIDVVSLVPPTSMEALPLPVWTVRRWLKGRAGADFADVEGAPQVPERERGGGRRALRWYGPDDDQTGVVTPEEIRPGDTIVVPTIYGGMDRFGWKPASDAEKEESVRDVGDDCSWLAKRRPVLRVHKDSQVHRSAASAWQVPPNGDGLPFIDALNAALPDVEGLDDADWGEVDQLLRGWAGLPAWWLQAGAGRKLRLVPYPEAAGVGAALLLPFQKPEHDEDAEGEFPPSGDDSSLLGTEADVSLRDHCVNVSRQVKEFTDRLGLDGPLAEVLQRAGLLHDAGKADDRFQLWLHGGNERNWLRAGATKLAKSRGADSHNRAAIRAARRKAGWPKAARHEAMSVLMVQDSEPANAGIADPCLLLFLIGSHHGQGRPFWRVELDDALPRNTHTDRDMPPEVRWIINGYYLVARGRFRPELDLARLDAGWVDRFWSLVRRYGYWGLAYLEMLLVLADHRQSARERDRKGKS